MTETTARIVYTCPPNIQWVKDTYQIVVIDERTNTSIILTDAKAAVWSWLSLRYPNHRLLDGLAPLLKLPQAEAENWLRVTLDDWYGQGLLIAAEAEDNG